LKVNGEAIYAARPRDGTLWKEGQEVRFTRSKDRRHVYAISLKWPGRELRLRSVRAAEGSRLRMLGREEPLVWRQDADGLAIEIPEELQNEPNRPCKQAYSFKIAAHAEAENRLGG
jgi:alpha-L-fucosidase